MSLLDLTAFILASSSLIIVVVSKINNKKTKVRVKANRIKK